MGIYFWNARKLISLRLYCLRAATTWSPDYGLISADILICATVHPSLPLCFPCRAIYPRPSHVHQSRRRWLLDRQSKSYRCAIHYWRYHYGSRSNCWDGTSSDFWRVDQYRCEGGFSISFFLQRLCKVLILGMIVYLGRVAGPTCMFWVLLYHSDHVWNQIVSHLYVFILVGTDRVRSILGVENMVNARDGGKILSAILSTAGPVIGRLCTMRWSFQVFAWLWVTIMSFVWMMSKVRLTNGQIIMKIRTIYRVIEYAGG